MPRPNGERRPGDVIGCALAMIKIAMGEFEDNKKSSKTHSGNIGAAMHIWNAAKEKCIEICRTFAAFGCA